MRVATWNVNYRGTAVAEHLGRLARESRIDLLLLQEANPNSVNELADAAEMDWVLTAYDAGAPVPATTGRRRVAAIAGRGSEPTSSGLLPGAAMEERAVVAHLESTLGEMTVAAYHAPPGVSWGLTKVHHAHALLAWINATQGHVIVGADANTPEVDHPDPDLTRTHWHTGSARLNGLVGDDVTFGGRPQHRLHDAYRRWLHDHPDEAERVSRDHPVGPLAISHHTGRRKVHAGTPRRFDALWVSPELGVKSVEYKYAAAVAAGTDHALVVADLA